MEGVGQRSALPSIPLLGCAHELEFVPNKREIEDSKGRFHSPCNHVLKENSPLVLEMDTSNNSAMFSVWCSAGAFNTTFNTTREAI